MKYAKEVIELLAAYPDKEFRMIQMVRYISSKNCFNQESRHAIRQGVRRVLLCLEESGQIKKRQINEKSAFYNWEL